MLVWVWKSKKPLLVSWIKRAWLRDSELRLIALIRSGAISSLGDPLANQRETGRRGREYLCEAARRRARSRNLLDSDRSGSDVIRADRGWIRFSKPQCSAGQRRMHKGEKDKEGKGGRQKDVFQDRSWLSEDGIRSVSIETGRIHASARLAARIKRKQTQRTHAAGPFKWPRRRLSDHVVSGRAPAASPLRTSWRGVSSWWRRAKTRIGATRRSVVAARPRLAADLRGGAVFAMIDRRARLSTLASGRKSENPSALALHAGNIAAWSYRWLRHPRRRGTSFNRHPRHPDRWLTWLGNFTGAAETLDSRYVHAARDSSIRFGGTPTLPDTSLGNGTRRRLVEIVRESSKSRGSSAGIEQREKVPLPALSKRLACTEQRAGTAWDTTLTLVFPFFLSFRHVHTADAAIRQPRASRLARVRREKMRNVATLARG
jgi:hypothetical protein